MKTWTKVGLIGASLGQGIALLPIELAMLPEHLHVIWIAFKAYTFIGMPLIIWLAIRRCDDEKND